MIQQVSKSFQDSCTPEELRKKIELMTIIDTKSNMIRLANLCFVSCNKVIFCSELQKKILLSEDYSPLREYYDFLEKSFILIDPGVNPRKWIHNCNKSLSKLITTQVDDESEWLTHLQLLRPLLSQVVTFKNDIVPEDSFFGKFMNVRLQNKQKLVNFMANERKDHNFLKGWNLKKTIFEGFLRKVLMSSRHLLLISYIIERYLHIKSLTKEEKSKMVPKVIFVGGSPRPGSILFLQLMKFMYQVAKLIENDKDVNMIFKLVFMPSHNNTKEYLFIPALDVNNQLTLPGKQACTSQPIKFVMNGCLLIGSKDATNMRIASTLGENIVLLFG